MVRATAPARSCSPRVRPDEGGDDDEAVVGVRRREAAWRERRRDILGGGEGRVKGWRVKGQSGGE